jgi:hypothetical protein
LPTAIQQYSTEGATPAITNLDFSALPSSLLKERGEFAFWARTDFKMVYDWENKEEICYRMYIEEKKSLEEIMEYLKENNGFAPR